MTRARTIAWIVLLSLAVPAAVLYLVGRQAAANGVKVWGDPHVSVIADTSSSMQPELDGLAAAWDDDVILRLLTATFHLVSFKDEADYLGSTQSAGQFGSWLNSLTAEGGAGCLNGALRGLSTLAPAESASFTVEVNIPANAPVGAIEEIALVAVPVGDLGGGLSAVSETTVVDKLKTFIPIVLR